jgi:hypothetical protein
MPGRGEFPVAEEVWASFAGAVDERDGRVLPADEVRDETILQLVPALKAELARRRPSATELGATAPAGSGHGGAAV